MVNEIIFSSNNAWKTDDDTKNGLKTVHGQQTVPSEKVFNFHSGLMPELYKTKEKEIKFSENVHRVWSIRAQTVLRMTQPLPHQMLAPSLSLMDV